MIGINSAIASQTGFYSGYGFAIPITLAKAVMDDLIRDGEVRLPVIGIQVSEVDPEDAGLAGLSRIAGVKVQTATPGGPAAKAGIESGDVVVTVAGREVDRVSALQRTVRTYDVGETIPVEVMRFGKKKTFNVTLEGAEQLPEIAGVSPAERAPTPTTTPTPTRLPATKLGITVESLTPQRVAELGLSVKGGLMVTDVESLGAARGKLIPNADIIIEITYPGERRSVTSVAELQAVVTALQPGDYLGLNVMRVGGGISQTQAVTLQVPKP